MQKRISEIQIVPVNPKDGLVGFASFVFDNCLHLGSIGIYTRPQGGYRLTYPTRKATNGTFNIFYNWIRTPHRRTSNSLSRHCDTSFGASRTGAKFYRLPALDSRQPLP